jgi:aspartate kinase
MSSTSLVVHKYGGTSVADADRIRAVARRVADARKAGSGVVVVVSAMGHTTDELLGLAAEVSPHHHPRELDMLLTAGERVSMALLAMAIADEGVEALSLTGSQAGILTDTEHGRAKITDIRAFRVEEALADGKVVIVAGFQGVSPDTKEITTLGRGGSDTTAVALAAALGADSCEICTDVDGVFTADPAIVAGARRLDSISYEEMLEMAANGAGVLSSRAADFSMRFRVPLHVRSSFHDGPGTWVKESAMEQPVVSGIVHEASAAKITVHGVPDRPGVAAALFQPLAAQGVNIDMIVQNISTAGATDISFTVPRPQAETARSVAEGVADAIGADGVDVDDSIAKVSIVGSGMHEAPGVPARMFEVLGTAGINIGMISTSAIRVSCVVAKDRAEEAVQLLHGAFFEAAP